MPNIESATGRSPFNKRHPSFFDPSFDPKIEKGLSSDDLCRLYEENQEKIVAEEEKGWISQCGLSYEQKNNILDALYYNAIELQKHGIEISTETGRNSIHNYTKILTEKATKEIIEYVEKKEAQFAHNKTEDEEYLDLQASLAEKIIVVQLAKCLSEDFIVYLPDRYEDIRLKKDLAVIDKVTKQVVFYIDATLGRKNKNQSTDQEKIRAVRQANIKGVMGYNDYRHNGSIYVPTTHLMTPLLCVSIPERDEQNENNLQNIIDRMSPSTESLSKGDFENTLYLIRQLIESLGTLKHIKENNLFDIREIQKRAGSLYRMLNPTEQSRWSSVRNEVQTAIDTWPERLAALEKRLLETEEILEKNSAIDH